MEGSLSAQDEPSAVVAQSTVPSTSSVVTSADAAIAATAADAATRAMAPSALLQHPAPSHVPHVGVSSIEAAALAASAELQLQTASTGGSTSRSPRMGGSGAGGGGTPVSDEPGGASSRSSRSGGVGGVGGRSVAPTSAPRVSDVVFGVSSASGSRSSSPVELLEVAQTAVVTGELNEDKPVAGGAAAVLAQTEAAQGLSSPTEAGGLGKTIPDGPHHAVVSGAAPIAAVDSAAAVAMGEGGVTSATEGSVKGVPVAATSATPPTSINENAHPSVVGLTTPTGSSSGSTLTIISIDAAAAAGASFADAVAAASQLSARLGGGGGDDAAPLAVPPSTQLADMEEAAGASPATQVETAEQQQQPIPAPQHDAEAGPPKVSSAAVVETDAASSPQLNVTTATPLMSLSAAVGESELSLNQASDVIAPTASAGSSNSAVGVVIEEEGASSNEVGVVAIPTDVSVSGTFELSPVIPQKQPAQQARPLMECAEAMGFPAPASSASSTEQLPHTMETVSELLPGGSSVPSAAQAAVDLRETVSAEVAGSDSLTVSAEVAGSDSLTVSAEAAGSDSLLPLQQHDSPLPPPSTASTSNIVVRDGEVIGGLPPSESVAVPSSTTRNGGAGDHMSSVNAVEDGAVHTSASQLPSDADARTGPGAATSAQQHSEVSSEPPSDVINMTSDASSEPTHPDPAPQNGGPPVPNNTADPAADAPTFTTPAADAADAAADASGSGGGGGGGSIEVDSAANDGGRGSRSSSRSGHSSSGSHRHHHHKPQLLFPGFPAVDTTARSTGDIASFVGDTSSKLAAPAIATLIEAEVAALVIPSPEVVHPVHVTSSTSAAETAVGDVNLSPPPSMLSTAVDVSSAAATNDAIDSSSSITPTGTPSGDESGIVPPVTSLSMVTTYAESNGAHHEEGSLLAASPAEASTVTPDSVAPAAIAQETPFATKGESTGTSGDGSTATHPHGDETVSRPPSGSTTRGSRGSRGSSRRQLGVQPEWGPPEEVPKTAADDASHAAAHSEEGGLAAAVVAQKVLAHADGSMVVFSGSISDALISSSDIPSGSKGILSSGDGGDGGESSSDASPHAELPHLSSHSPPAATPVPLYCEVQNEAASLPVDHDGSGTSALSAQDGDGAAAAASLSGGRGHQSSGAGGGEDTRGHSSSSSSSISGGGNGHGPKRTSSNLHLRPPTPMRRSTPATGECGAIDKSGSSSGVGEAGFSASRDGVIGAEGHTTGVSTSEAFFSTVSAAEQQAQDSPSTPTAGADADDTEVEDSGDWNSAHSSASPLLLQGGDSSLTSDFDGGKSDNGHHLLSVAGSCGVLEPTTNAPDGNYVGGGGGGGDGSEEEIGEAISSSDMREGAASSSYPGEAAEGGAPTSQSWGGGDASSSSGGGGGVVVRSWTITPQELKEEEKEEEEAAAAAASASTVQVGTEVIITSTTTSRIPSPGVPTGATRSSSSGGRGSKLLKLGYSSVPSSSRKLAALPATTTTSSTPVSSTPRTAGESSSTNNNSSGESRNSRGGSGGVEAAVPQSLPQVTFPPSDEAPTTFRSSSNVGSSSIVFTGDDTAPLYLGGGEGGESGTTSSISGAITSFLRDHEGGVRQLFEELRRLAAVSAAAHDAAVAAANGAASSIHITASIAPPYATTNPTQPSSSAAASADAPYSSAEDKDGVPLPAFVAGLSRFAAVKGWGAPGFADILPLAAFSSTSGGGTSVIGRGGGGASTSAAATATPSISWAGYRRMVAAVSTVAVSIARDAESSATDANVAARGSANGDSTTSVRTPSADAGGGGLGSVPPHLHRRLSNA